MDDSSNPIKLATFREREAVRASHIRDPSRPRDVIVAACAQIGERLSDAGFSFGKSGPALKKVDGDLTYRIHFASDKWNAAEERACVRASCFVHSKTLAKWRAGQTHPVLQQSDLQRSGPDAGRVAGICLGDLKPERGRLEWDFADSRFRRVRINEAAEIIRQCALPYFARFSDLEASLPSLVRQHEFFPMTGLLEYAFLNLGRDAAEKTGRAFLVAQPSLRPAFKQRLASLAGATAPLPWRGMVDHMADVAFATGIDLLGDEES